MKLGLVADIRKDWYPQSFCKYDDDVAADVVTAEEEFPVEVDPSVPVLPPHI